MQAFLYQQAAIELQNAINALNEVQNTFEFNQYFNGELTESEFDYTDVLFFKAYANVLLYQIAFQQGLEVGVDLKSIWQDDTQTYETILSDYPDLLKTTDPVALANARAFAGVALKDLNAAIVSMEDEDDDQTDDFINFYDVDPTVQTADIADAKTDISQAMQVFYGDTDYLIDDKTVVINLNALFSGTCRFGPCCPLTQRISPACSPIPPWAAWSVPTST